MAMPEIPDGYFRLVFEGKQICLPASMELTVAGIATYFGVSTTFIFFFITISFLSRLTQFRIFLFFVAGWS